MIYCIIPDENIPFFEIVESIQSLGNFRMSNDRFFIDSNLEYNDFLLGLKIKVKEFSLITKKSDINEISQNTKDWCVSILERDALKKFENTEEAQNRMKEIMLYFDEIEKNRIKKGGDKIARTKTGNRKKKENDTEKSAGI